MSLTIECGSTNQNLFPIFIIIFFLADSFFLVNGRILNIQRKIKNLIFFDECKASEKCVLKLENKLGLS